MVQNLEYLNFVDSFNLIKEYKKVHQEFYEDYLNIIESFDEDMSEKVDNAFENNDLSTIRSVHDELEEKLDTLISFLEEYSAKIESQDENLLEEVNNILENFDFKLHNHEPNPYYTFIADVLLLMDVYESSIDLISYSEYNLFSQIIGMVIINENIESKSDKLIDLYDNLLNILSNFLDEMNSIYNKIYDIIDENSNNILSITIESNHIISFFENAQDSIEEYFLSIDKMISDMPKFDAEKHSGLDLDYVLIKDDVIRDFILRNDEWVFDYNEFLYELEDFLTDYSPGYIDENVGEDFIPTIINWVIKIDECVIDYSKKVRDYKSNMSNFYEVKLKEPDSDLEGYVSLNEHFIEIDDLIEDIYEVEPFFKDSLR